MTQFTRLIILISCLSLIACNDALPEFKASSFHKYIDVGVIDADLSQGGQLTALLDINQNISIWNNDNHTLVSSIANTSFAQLQYHIVMSGNKNVLVSASKTGISIFSIETSKHIATWPIKGFSNDSQVTQIAVNYMADKVFVGLNEGTIVGIDLLAKTQSLHKMHDSSVTKLFIHPNGQSVFSAGNDGTAVHWHINTGQQIWARNFNQRITSFTHDNFSEKVFVSDALNNQQVINLNTDSTVSLDYLERMRFFRQALFVANGEKLLTASSKFQLSLWDSKTGQERAFGQVRSYNFGSMILDFASVGTHKVLSLSSDGVLEVWDLADY